MSPDEFHLFSTYSYLFGNKRVKSNLSTSRVFLMGGTPEVHSSRSTPPKHGARSSHSPSPQSKPGGTKREVENEDACLNAHNFNSIEIAAFIVSCAGRFELQCLSCALALSLYLFPLV